MYDYMHKEHILKILQKTECNKIYYVSNPTKKWNTKIDTKHVCGFLL
jgi:hypothetical protein